MTSALVLALGAAGLTVTGGGAADWPMWRYDAARGASTPHGLPGAMELLWAREFPAPRPAWPETQEKLQFDAAPQPIVVGNRLIVPSTVDDSVTAFNTASGGQEWQFFADGPVRFAPAALGERVFAVSDDGYLHCLRAATGELLWKVNGGPAERRVIGNHRLISSWPARGGPAVHGGRVYFTASIWPFMGIFIHCVDPASGAVLWTNSGDGTNYTVQPHGAPSFASVVPQGHLVVLGDDLVVPGGRSTPAVFDLETGQLRHFRFDKKNGGHRVMGGGDLYFLAGGAYSLETGRRVSNEDPRTADGEVLVFEEKGRITGRSASAEIARETVKDRKGRDQVVQVYKRETRFSFEPEGGSSAVFLRAGDRVYTAGKGEVAAYELASAEDEREPSWTAVVDGRVDHLLAGDGKLFVVAGGGGDPVRVSCFGRPVPGGRTGVVHRRPDPTPLDRPPRGSPPAALVAELMEDRGLREGFGLVLGAGTGALVGELLAQSELDLVVLEPSAREVDRLRRTFDRVGVYGTRVAVHAGGVATASLPPYFASLIVGGDLAAAGYEPGSRDFVEKVFRSLRPYGGTAVFTATRAQHESIESFVAAAGDGLAGARLSREGGVTRLVRHGALPGTDDWTHQYGNAAQTGISADHRVRAPLGLLWFGGPSHAGILPRHGHGPSPQVAGGRLVIEGPDQLRAVDVYTGRVLWEKELPGLGTYYNTTRHFPGAGEIGSNYVTLPDRVYAVHGSEIVVLDAATGETLKALSPPPRAAPDGEGAPGKDTPAPAWGYLGAAGGFLIATSAPVRAAPGDEKGGARPSVGRRGFLDLFRESRYAPASRRLLVFDRHTGDLLWGREARLSFRHNNIAVASGMVYCIDALSPALASRAKDPARADSGNPGARLYALDLKTGREVWVAKEGIFGTFLNYSAEHDVLLQGGSKYRDRAKDEIGRGMVAYRGKTGEVLWRNLEVSYGGPCLLWHDRIITNGGGGFGLNLLTGEETGWSYSRMYGCNTAVGSEHLLTFRSGAAGFYDLAGDGGTGNIGGFRSSCTNNLIIANGVLNAPDYTRTCSCAYQNQTSLALVHMPEAEFWTFGAAQTAGRTGINFGAPGDRRDPGGTLWIEYPSVGGPSDEAGVSVEPRAPEVFRFHTSTLGGGGGELGWVAASGAVGVRSVNVPVDAGGTYRVRLFFTEPDDATVPGERVMDLTLQGDRVLAGLDLAEVGAGPRRAVIREFGVKPAGKEIVVGLAARGPRPTVISGVEVVRR